MKERFAALYALYKVFGWVALVIFVLVAFAALRRPAAVSPESTPETIHARAQDFDAKLQHLADAHERGESSEARFSAEEINAAISRTMSESAEQAASHPAASAPRPAQNLPPPDAVTPGTPGGAPIRTVRVAFQGSEVTGQFSTEMYGKEIYITLSGTLGSRDGYVIFEPTAFKVGNLIVPVDWMKESFHRKLAEPENREKLKLPDFIASLRVENGELVITEK